MQEAAVEEDFDHSQFLALTYTWFAGLLHESQRLEEATQMYRQALTLFERLIAEYPGASMFPEQMADALRAMTSVAHTHFSRGARAEADDLMSDVLEISRRTLGPDHLSTLNILDSAAIVFFQQGRHTEAHTLYAEELEVRRRLLANGLAIWTPDDPDLAQCMNDLAWLLSTCPDTQLRVPQEAVALATKVMELAPNNAVYENTLGVAQYRAGDYAAAVETLNKCVAMTTGTVHDFLFLAMAHAQMGNFQEGKKWFVQAVGLLNESDSRYAELQLFRAEAAQLLGITDQPEQQPKRNRFQLSGSG